MGSICIIVRLFVFEATKVQMNYETDKLCVQKKGEKISILFLMNLVGE